MVSTGGGGKDMALDVVCEEDLGGPNGARCKRMEDMNLRLFGACTLDLTE